MSHKEKDFQRLFGIWCRHNIKESCAFELKITHGTSLPFSHLALHQKENLLAVKHNKLIFKIPDGSGQQTPFDSFCLTECSSWVVVQFHRRGQKEFFLIDIDDWCAEENSGKRKSLTEERAREIGKSCMLA